MSWPNSGPGVNAGIGVGINSDYTEDQLAAMELAGTLPPETLLANDVSELSYAKTAFVRQRFGPSEHLGTKGYLQVLGLGVWPEGTTVDVDDLGNQIIRLRSDGAAFRVQGEQLLYSNYGYVGQTANTDATEKVLPGCIVPFPRKLLSRTGASFRLWAGMNKGTDILTTTGNLRLRFGSAGTIADAILHDYTLTTNRQTSYDVLYQRLSNTTLERQGSSIAANPTFLTGNVSAAAQGTVAVPDMDTIDSFLHLDWMTDITTAYMRVNLFQVYIKG